MDVIMIPAVLSTKQCFDYCGGQPLFEELLEKHGDILKPVRTTPRGDRYFRRATVDAALIVAEQAESLIARPDREAKRVVKQKNSRRFIKSTTA